MKTCPHCHMVILDGPRYCCREYMEGGMNQKAARGLRRAPLEPIYGLNELKQRIAELEAEKKQLYEAVLERNEQIINLSSSILAEECHTLRNQLQEAMLDAACEKTALVERLQNDQRKIANLEKTIRALVDALPAKEAK